MLYCKKLYEKGLSTVCIVVKLIVNIKKREDALALVAALRRKVAKNHFGEQHTLCEPRQVVKQVTTVCCF